MERKNLLFGLVGLVVVVFGFTAKAFYRPYVSANHINDLGIADSSPSFFYVIGFSILLLLKPYKYGWLSIVIVTMASIAFEFMQLYNNKSLDIRDIIASLIGGIISVLIWTTIEKNFKKAQ